MEKLTLEKIDSTTAIHDFPEIYKSNNEKIVQQFEDFETALLSYKASQQSALDTLKKAFKLLQANLTNEIRQTINSEKIQEEITGVYTTSQIDAMMATINKRLTQLENN